MLTAFVIQLFGMNVALRCSVVIFKSVDDKIVG